MNTVSQGNVFAIYVPDGQSQEMFIGFEVGGLWHTTDGGQNWNCISDGFLSNGSIGITDIVADPNHANHLSLGTVVGGGDGRNYTSWGYGQGVWHSTDGGLTWSQDTGFGSMDKAIDLAYSFDLIGTTDRMLWFTDGSEKVFSKIGGGAVADISTALQSFGFPGPDSTEVVDIDFADDTSGIAYISTKSKWGYIQPNGPAYFVPSVGVWKVDYDITTGAITAVNRLFDESNTVDYTNTINDTVYDLRTTYIGNGELYSVMHNGGYTVPIGRAVVMHYDATNWQLVMNDITGGSLGNVTFHTHSMMSIESSKEDPNTIYLGLTLPIKLTKVGNTWNPMEIFHTYFTPYSTPQCTPGYTTCVFAKNGTAADEVYWGHDGGFNKGTSTTTYSNIPTHKVYTTMAYELDISNLGNKKAIATFHNGLINTEAGGAAPWESTVRVANANVGTEVYGDLFGVFYDHRMDNDNQELLFHPYNFWRHATHTNTNMQDYDKDYHSPIKWGNGWSELHRPYQYPQDLTWVMTLWM